MEEAAEEQPFHRMSSQRRRKLWSLAARAAAKCPDEAEKPSNISGSMPLESRKPSLAKTQDSGLSVDIHGGGSRRSTTSMGSSFVSPPHRVSFEVHPSRSGATTSNIKRARPPHRFLSDQYPPYQSDVADQLFQYPPTSVPLAARVRPFSMPTVNPLMPASHSRAIYYPVRRRQTTIQTGSADSSGIGSSLDWASTDAAHQQLYRFNASHLTLPRFANVGSSTRSFDEALIRGRRTHPIAAYQPQIQNHPTWQPTHSRTVEVVSDHLCPAVKNAPVVYSSHAENISPVVCRIPLHDPLQPTTPNPHITSWFNSSPLPYPYADFRGSRGNYRVSRSFDQPQTRREAQFGSGFRHLAQRGRYYRHFSSDQNAMSRDSYYMPYATSICAPSVDVHSEHFFETVNPFSLPWAAGSAVAHRGESTRSYAQRSEPINPEIEHYHPLVMYSVPPPTNEDDEPSDECTDDNVSTLGARSVPMHADRASWLAGSNINRMSFPSEDVTKWTECGICSLGQGLQWSSQGSHHGHIGSRKFIPLKIDDQTTEYAGGAMQGFLRTPVQSSQRPKLKPVRQVVTRTLSGTRRSAEPLPSFVSTEDVDREQPHPSRFGSQHGNLSDEDAELKPSEQIVQPSSVRSPIQRSSISRPLVHPDYVRLGGSSRIHLSPDGRRTTEPETQAGPKELVYPLRPALKKTGQSTSTESQAQSTITDVTTRVPESSHRRLSQSSSEDLTEYKTTHPLQAAALDASESFITSQESQPKPSPAAGGIWPAEAPSRIALGIHPKVPVSAASSIVEDYVEYWDHTIFVRARIGAVTLAGIASICLFYTTGSNTWVYQGAAENLTHSGFWEQCNYVNRTCELTIPFVVQRAGWQDGALCILLFAVLLGLLGTSLSIAGHFVFVMSKRLYYFHSSGETHVVAAMTTALSAGVYYLTSIIHLHTTGPVSFGHAFYISWLGCALHLLVAFLLFIDEIVHRMATSSINAKLVRSMLRRFPVMYIQSKQKRVVRRPIVN